MAKDEIQIIRTFAGEVIIGKVTSDTKDKLTVAKPAIIYQQNGPNGPQVGLAPLAPFNKNETVALNKDGILFNELAAPEMVQNYIKATTNLDIPAASKLILG